MMTNQRFRWAIVAVLLLLGGTGMLFAQASQPSQREIDAFRTAVDAAYQTWRDTNINPNLDRFAALWDDNAVKMASGRPTVYGAAQIRQFKQKAFGLTAYDRFEINVDEYQPAGQFGWARGTYLISSHPKAGGPESTDVGTFLTVFKRQADGTWKVYRDTMMEAPK